MHVWHHVVTFAETLEGSEQLAAAGARAVALPAEPGELPGGEAHALAVVMAEQPDASQEGAVGTRRDGGSALACFQQALKVHSSSVQSQDLLQGQAGSQSGDSGAGSGCCRPGPMAACEVLTAAPCM